MLSTQSGSRHLHRYSKYPLSRYRGRRPRYPAPPCTFCSGGAFFQAEQQLFQFVWQYPLSDFTGLGGNVILASESGGDGADTSLVTFNGTNYVQTSFGPRPPGVNEGASFVDCDVPTATPTLTAYATTATSTAH